MASLTMEQARLIAGKDRKEGRLELAKNLSIEEFDEEDEMQKSILLDYYHDNLMFAVKKGFPWSEIGPVLSLATEMVDEFKDKTLSETVKLYKKKCEKYKGKISETSLKTYTDFFFSTFMSNFKLYQYVFTQAQDEYIQRYNLPVECPQTPPRMKDSKHIRIWEYEKKLEELEETEKAAKTERDRKTVEREQEDKDNLENVLRKVDDSETPYQREALQVLISEVAQAHLTAAMNSISDNIDYTIQDLNSLLAKTSLPRPPELGPPARAQLKTPMLKQLMVKREKTRSSSRTSNAPSRSGSRASSKH